MSRIESAREAMRIVQIRIYFELHRVISIELARHIGKPRPLEARAVSGPPAPEELAPILATVVAFIVLGFIAVRAGTTSGTVNGCHGRTPSASPREPSLWSPFPGFSW